MRNVAPAALAARGLVALTDNIPPRFGLSVSGDLLRVFRDEIQARLIGLPAPAMKPARLHSVPGRRP